MNISFDALMAAGGSTATDPSAFLQLGDHDPEQKRFLICATRKSPSTARSILISKASRTSCSSSTTTTRRASSWKKPICNPTSLPGNLQLKAGQFFANFGRQNPAASAHLGVCGSADHFGTRVWAGRFAEHRHATLVARADAVLYGSVSRRFRRARRHGIQLPQSGRSRRAWA